MVKMLCRARSAKPVTDGTVTLDGSADCFPLSTNFTSKAVDVGIYKDICIYLKCSDVTTGIATKYQVSVDGKNWTDGETTITAMDNNEQWIVLGTNELKYAIQYMRINANNTNTAAATATVIISSRA